MAARIEAKAELSVGRACGFGGIGIATFMVATMTEPPLSFLTGGVLTLLTCFIHRFALHPGECRGCAVSAAAGRQRAHTCPHRAGL